jgi:hypothetical protein
VKLPLLSTMTGPEISPEAHAPWTMVPVGACRSAKPLPAQFPVSGLPVAGAGARAALPGAGAFAVLAAASAAAGSIKTRTAGSNFIMAAVSHCFAGVRNDPHEKRAEPCGAARDFPAATIRR